MKAAQKPVDDLIRKEDQLVKKLVQVRNEQQKIKTTAAQTSQAAKASVESHAQKVDKLKKRLVEAKEEYRKIKKASVDSSRSASAALKKQRLEVKRLTKDLKEAEKHAKTAGVSVGGVGGAAAQAGEAGASAWGRFSGVVKSFGVLMGGTIISLVGFQLMNAFREMMREVVQFEVRFANVRTLVDETVVPISVLREEVLGLGGSLGRATDLADGLYQTISAGVHHAEAVRFLGRCREVRKGCSHRHFHVSGRDDHHCQRLWSGGERRSSCF